MISSFFQAVPTQPRARNSLATSSLFRIREQLWARPELLVELCGDSTIPEDLLHQIDLVQRAAFLGRARLIGGERELAREQMALAFERTEVLITHLDTSLVEGLDGLLGACQKSFSRLAVSKDELSELDLALGWLNEFRASWGQSLVMLRSSSD